MRNLQWRRLMSFFLTLALVLGMSNVYVPLEVKANDSYIYVATNGNDTTGNGSSSSPYRTIRRAAEVATPGTTVLVRGGTYNEHSIRPNSGTATAMIVFKPASNNDEVIIKHPETFSSYANPDAEYVRRGTSPIFSLTDVFDLWQRNYVQIEGFTFRDYKYVRNTIAISGEGNVIINNRFINIGCTASQGTQWTNMGPRIGGVTVNVTGNHNVVRNNYFQSNFGEDICINGSTAHNLISENTFIGNRSKDDSTNCAINGRFGGNLHNLVSFNYNGGSESGYSIWLDVDVRDFTALRNVAHNTSAFIFNESGCKRNWVYENVIFNKRRGANNRMQDNAGNFNDFSAQRMNGALLTAFWDTGSTFDARWINNVTYNVREGLNMERTFRDEARNNIFYEDERNEHPLNDTYGFRVFEPALIGFGNNFNLGYQLRGGGPHIMRSNLAYSARRTNGEFVSFMFPTGGRTTVDNFQQMADDFPDVTGINYDLAVDPGFVNAQAFDFTLREDSPARGTGDNGVDRGAYAIYPKTDVGFNSNYRLTNDINVSFSRLNSSTRPNNSVNIGVSPGESFNIELRLSRPAAGTMNFDVVPVAGDAREDLDFRFPNGNRVTFNAGQSVQNLRIEILDGNPHFNFDQLLALRLNPVSGSTTAEDIGGRNLHLIKIRRVTEFTVTLHNTVTTQNGVTSIGRPVVTTHRPGDTVTIRAGSRSGFTFGRWTDGYHDEKVWVHPNYADGQFNPAIFDATTTFTMPQRNVTLQARWNPRWEVAPKGDTWDRHWQIPAAPVRTTGVSVPSTSSVAVGSSTTLTATVTPSNASLSSVRWISSNPLVAKVDPITGRVTGVSAGTARIVAKPMDGGDRDHQQFSATCTVTVTGGPATPPVRLVKMNLSTMFLNANEMRNINASVLPAGANQGLTWTSSNPQVATVNSSGRVTAVADGIAIITATSNADTTKSVSCTVIVGDISTTPPDLDVIEAEDFDVQHGIDVEDCSEGGSNVAYIENNDYIGFLGVDFRGGADSLDFRIGTPNSGNTLEVRLGSPTGRLIGTLTVASTGGWQTWETQTAAIEQIEDIQDIYFVFKGGEGFLYNLNWWRINYSYFEAEDFDVQEGIDVEDCSEGGKNVGFIQDGNYIGFTDVDFNDGADRLRFRVAANDDSGGTIEVRLGSPDGRLIGTMNVTPTGGWQTWETQQTPIELTKGIHDVYFVFRGDSWFLFNINWWNMGRHGESPINWNPDRRLDPVDANVSQLGNDNHLLRLELTDLNRTRLLNSTSGGVLNFSFDPAWNTSRRILVWTDLSAYPEEQMTSAGGTTAFTPEPVERENITFAISSNIAAGNFADTGQVRISNSLASGDDSASIVIPRELLVSGNTAAKYIYVIFTVEIGAGAVPGSNAAEGTDRATRVSNNRMNSPRADMGVPSPLAERDVISQVVLNISFTEPILHQVIFDLAGGERTGGGEEIQFVIDGDNAEPPTVEREGFTFNGWDGDYTNVISGRTITALWTEDVPDTWTVTFDLAGGVRTGGGYEEQIVADGDAAEPPIVEREGFTFDGWDGDYTNVTSDRTITALWTEDINDSFKITFNPNGGEFVNPERDATRYVAKGENAGILPRAVPSMFSREEYRFMGWFEDIEDDSTRWRDNNAVTANVTLYARWAQLPEPANFRVGDANSDGRITSADSTTIARWLITNQDNISSISICMYASDIDGDGEVTVADVTLLARWLIGLSVGNLIAY